MGIEDTTPTEEERGFLSFPHQHFIDFLAGKYVSELQKVSILLKTRSFSKPSTVGFHSKLIIMTARQQSCKKVTFSVVSVILFIGVESNVSIMYDQLDLTFVNIYCVLPPFSAGRPGLFVSQLEIYSQTPKCDNICLWFG